MKGRLAGASTALLLSTVAHLALLPGEAAAATCESLRNLALEDTEITLAESKPAGTFTAPVATPPPATPAPPLEGLPAFCRVAGVIRPTADSNIRFELWLPSVGYNSRFMSQGEGGFSGNINYGGLAMSLRDGYATSSTDTGHVGGTADFALGEGREERIVDWGHRAKHLQAVRSKQIIDAFYGAGPRYSYFNSCSNGGRQGLMEAQRYPEDYDGIIVGAPAHRWVTNWSAALLYNEAVLRENPIPATKLPAIQQAVTEACDTIDGVADGVLEDPRQCNFDPSALLCTAGETDECLTEGQVGSLEKIIAGYRHPETGEQVYPGWPPDQVAEPGNWDTWIINPVRDGRSIQGFFGWGTFAKIVNNDPAWDPATEGIEETLAKAEAEYEEIIDADETDMSAFKERGGKIIMYHGWADAAISALDSIDYYEDVIVANTSANDNGEGEAARRETEEFFRLFLVPGMGHCSGGPAATSFGQSANSPALREDPGYDIVEALRAWVEHDMAPEKIIAAKYLDNDPVKGVDITHPLCKYPATAVYEGSGATDRAINYRCVDQNRMD